MKRMTTGYGATLLALILAVAGCGGGGEEGAAGSGANPGSGVVRIDSDITSPATWTDAHVYVVDGENRVYSSLVIQPGTTVKFERNGSLSTAGSGGIIADGSTSRRIRFTSVRDDSRGGDTNGDGTTTSPSRGDWRGISLEGGYGSVFRNCDFAYSGDSYEGRGGPALDLGTTDFAVVEGCVFSDNDGGDPGRPCGALQADRAGAATVVARNVFFGNNVPLSIHPAVRAGDGNVFHDPAIPARANRYNGIFVSGGDLTAPAAWTAQEVPFVVSERLLVHQALTLGPGTTVKFQAAALMETANSGTIIASGTAASRVVFTSIRDDAHGGDTNGDGTATLPSRGDWARIALYGANGSRFANCDFRYGGADGYGALCLEHTNLTTVDGCVFADIDGGSAVAPWGALDAVFADSGTVITNNTFFGNTVPLAIDEAVGMDDSNLFHDPANAARTNVYNGIFVSPRGNLAAPVRWSATEVPFVFNDTMRLFDTLTLGPGVVLKFAAEHGLEVYRPSGAINAGPGVVFTSIRDDAHLGDTNGDGRATTPQTYDWDGIYYEYLGGMNAIYASWPNILYDSH